MIPRNSRNQPRLIRHFCSQVLQQHKARSKKLKMLLSISVASYHQTLFLMKGLCIKSQNKPLLSITAIPLNHYIIFEYKRAFGCDVVGRNDFLLCFCPFLSGKKGFTAAACVTGQTSFSICGTNLK